MANHTTQGCVRVTNITKASFEKLVKQIEWISNDICFYCDYRDNSVMTYPSGYTVAPTDYDPAQPIHETSYNEDTHEGLIWSHSDFCLWDIEVAFDDMCDALERTSEVEPVRMRGSYAFTCDKADPDGFGGGYIEMCSQL